jgi:dephospho-CoA kinase
MTVQKFEGLRAAQVPDAEKRRRADFVVDTGQGFEVARAQVRDILAAVRNMSARGR